MEKLCVFCKHFEWEATRDYTRSYGTCGGTEGGASCGKGHYSEQQPYDAYELRELYLKASSCPDYSPPSQEK